MTDEYTARVIEHYKIQGEITLELLQIARRLCPGDWVLQVLPTLAKGKEDKRVLAYEVTVTNGDDNVTACNENLGAAIAQLIYYMLNGSVFPLTGNGGYHYFPGDRGWIRKIDPKTKK
jgi:hypothetical protein